jgi:hypothetical protein
VVSGAAGSYIVTLMEDMSLSADLIIQPGQDVRIVGDPTLPVPSWGSGGLSVRERGSLSLVGVAPTGTLTVKTGGDLTLRACVIDDTDILVKVLLRASARLYSVQVTLPDGTTPLLTGALPGTLTATIEGRQVGIITAADGIVTGTGSMAGMTILQTWSSGGSTNTHGKAFALYLLPAQPANYFNHHSPGGNVDPIAAQRYSDACAAAGLRTVTTGEGGSGAPENCAAYNCIPLTPDGNSVAQWVGQATRWDYFVTHDGGQAYPIGYVGGPSDASVGNAELHPVCGLEW